MKVTAEHIVLAKGFIYSLAINVLVTWEVRKYVYITRIENFAMLVITYIFLRISFIFSGVSYGESLSGSIFCLF